MQEYKYTFEKYVALAYNKKCYKRHRAELTKLHHETSLVDRHILKYASK